MRKSDAPEARALATWQTGINGMDWLEELVAKGIGADLGGNGYPNTYEMPAGVMLAILANGIPKHGGPTVAGDDYVLPRGWTGNASIDLERLRSMEPSEILIVEAWDQSRAPIAERTPGAHDAFEAQPRGQHGRPGDGAARRWMTAGYLGTFRRHMKTSARALGVIAVGVCTALLAACASTDVTLSPSPQAPVCDPSATALVLWAPQWRPDQKDVAAREEAAAAGLGSFFAASGCFAHTELRRASSLSSSAVTSEPRASPDRFDALVTIAVRELGPVVKLLSSASLVEGGTEVVLHVTSRRLQPRDQPREFTVQWRNGGPGVVKGVASLPGDMSAALRAGLQPAAATQ